jgi:hypothetical protein
VAIRFRDPSLWVPERYRDDPVAGFLCMWEFWLGLAVFYLISVFFPWYWLAQTGLFDGFVAMMATVIQSIDGLPQEWLHRPRPASELQLSFIHFVAITFLVVKVVRQKPHPGFEKIPAWRLAVLVLSTAGGIPLFTALAIIWQGENHSAAEAGEVFHANMYQVPLLHIFLWFVPLAFWAFGKAVVQEITRRTRDTFFQ